MEKIVHRISFFISAVLLYMLSAYLYLSYKGFVYQDGDFVLISNANAGLLDGLNTKEEESQPFALPVKKDVAFNWPRKLIAGQDDAPLSIYEFSSLGCTHCADFHLNILPKLEDNYISTGKINVAFVHFPLDKRSMQVAMIAECFEGQKRSDFITLAFSKQREWGLAVDPTNYFINYGVMNGLKPAEVEKCMKNDETAKEILFNRQEAIDKLKIQGTPAFLVSSENKNEIIYGISNINELKGYLDKRLSEEEK